MGAATTGEDAGAVARRAGWVGAGVILLTALSWIFPGHTYLHSDTQIYLPILERLRDPALFARDLVALRPHVSFTIYDEATLGLARLTGLSLEQVLIAQQLLFRALGILGVFLTAAAFRLRDRLALIVAAVFALGATVAGPTVLTLEHEPVPRGFAVPLVLLAIGLAAHDRDVLAGIAASLAFLYHPPSVATLWAVYFLLTLWPSQPQQMSRRILGLAPILAGVLALLVFSRLQSGVLELQPFFGRIDAELERLQRIRASYNWVGTWAAELLPHYLALWLLSVAAFWRLRRETPVDLEFFLLGLPLLGIASVPLSWLLLERLKWIAAPQIQPARALVFVTALAAITAATAGLRSVLEGGRWAGGAWLLAAFSIPLLPDLLRAPLRPRLLGTAALFAALAAFAAWTESRGWRWSWAPCLATLVLPFLLAGPVAGIAPPRQAETPELQALAAWAREATPQDAVFLFPDAGKGVEPGIFRARALRALYVDWKSGGQVNFLRRLGYEWWRRWQQTGAGRFKPWHLPAYRRWGIDYIVLPAARRLPNRQSAFQNSSYVVYLTQ